MKIAILGWGSVIWDRQHLKLADGIWHADGPVLPIEFGAVRPDEWSNLLCGDTWVVRVRTLWAESALDRLTDARKDLAAHVGLNGGDQQVLDQIGYVLHDGEGQLAPLGNDAATNEVRERLRRWLTQHPEYQAIIWGDSRANWDGVIDPPPTEPDQIVQYLRLLPPNAPAGRMARNHFQRAPTQLWTAVRGGLASEPDWSPDLVPRIQSADDLRFKEWEECRKTIGRIDTILESLRKLSFSLITGLLTASAFLGFLGVTTSQNVSPPSSAVSAAVFITIVTLIAALFSVDNHFQNVLSGAVERALDLESLTDPPVRVTKYISANAQKTYSSFVAFTLYVGLLIVALGLGVLGVLNTERQGPPPALTTAALIVPFTLSQVMLAVLVALLAWYAAVILPIRVPRWSVRSAIISSSSSAVAALILGYVVSSVPMAALLGIGALSVTFIVTYWRWSSEKTGLLRDKERRWLPGETARSKTIFP